MHSSVGMVFQKANPFPAMFIADNVVAGLRLTGVKDKKRLDKPGGGLFRWSAATTISS